MPRDEPAPPRDLRLLARAGPPAHSRVVRTRWAPPAVGLGAAVGAAAGLLLRRRLARWGTTAAEAGARLPGDELVPEPADVATRAVTVHAPASEVWPWLVQIGQDRGGLYSYDLLENLVGLRIHSAGWVLPECQQLEAGDRVRLVPRGWMALREGLSLPVAMVEPGRALVLRESPPEYPWDAIWSFHVLPVGEDRCRLVSRSRTAHGAGPAGFAARVAAWVMDPVVAVMTRKMLLGIKKRAELRHHIHTLAA